MSAWVNAKRPATVAGARTNAAASAASKQVEHVVLVDVGGAGEQLQVEVPADHRRGRQHPGRLRAEARHPGADHLADRVRESQLLHGEVRHPPPGVVPVDRPGLDQVPQHLGHEERVAVGLPVQRMGEPDPGVVQLVAGGGLQQVDDTAVVQTLQVDPGDPVHPPQRRQRLDQRVPGPDLGVAIGAQHQQTASAGSSPTTWRSSCRLAVSAHCRSSTTSTTGRSRRRDGTGPTTAANSRYRSVSASLDVGGSTSGSRRVNAGTIRARSAPHSAT